MLLSIILPVYNAQSSLSNAVESVINQTNGDWELLIIDDNSSDNSLEIAFFFAKKDGRIKVFSNLENLGPAQTRNIGIENAKGKYVGFIDADDTYDREFVSTMIMKAENLEAEIIWCNYLSKSTDQDKGIKISNKIQKNIVYSNQEAINFFFKNTPGIGSLCNKLYRKDFLYKNKITLNPERIRAEDWEFNLMAFSKVKSLVLVDEYLYNYIRGNKESIMATFRVKDYELIFRSMKLLQEVNSRFNLGKSQKEIINSNKIHILEMIYRGLSSREFKKFHSIIKEKKLREILKLIDYHQLPPTYKILCFLLKNNFYICAITFSYFSDNLFHAHKK